MKKPGWPFNKGHFLFYQPVGGINIKAPIAEMFGQPAGAIIKVFYQQKYSVSQ